VYDKDGGEPRFQTPANTAVEGYFYTVQKEDGTKDDSVEKLLADVESDAKPILDRWLTERSMSDRDEVATVALFLAFMHTRGPRNIEAVKEMTTIFAIEGMKALADHPDELKGYLAQLKADEGIDWPLDEAVDALRNIEERLKLSIQNEYPLVASLQQAETIRDELMAMDWGMGEAPKDTFYLTGDTPLCVFLPSDDGRASFGGGFGQKAVEVTFPLSPNRCLFIRRQASTQLSLREINRRTAHVAEQYVISPYRSPPADAFVEHARQTHGLPKMDREEFGRVARMALEMHDMRDDDEKEA
jgi:hypothetical protein